MTVQRGAMDPALRDLFNRVLAEYPGGIIAGGAVRDAHLGYPIRDIDVWMSWEDADRTLGPGYVSSLADDYERLHSIGRYLFEPRWSPYPIHVIITSDAEPMTEDPGTLLASFDYGLCMIAWTPEGLHLTPEFVRDELDRHMTLVNPGHTSRKRYERLSEKFPGWQIDAPEPEELDLDGDDPTF